MSRLAPTLCIATLALACTTPPAHAQRKNPNAPAVLLLSGGQREHHGYRDQANTLARNLEETGRYRITIVEDAAILETPALDKYRAVILLTDRRDPEFRLTESQQKSLLAYVGDGRGGFVSLHGGNNAAPDWLPEMRTLLGGVFSHDTSGGRPDGKVRKGRYQVRITQPDHPICSGSTDFELDDELYYHMQMEPGIVPLATIRHDGVDWPIAWTNRYGRGNVFHTPLGHRDFGADKHDPLADPNLFRMVDAGLTWVCGGTNAP